MVLGWLQPHDLLHRDILHQGSRATSSFLVPWALSASTSVCILCNIWILLLRVGAGPRIFHWLKVQSIVCLMWTSGSPDPWEPLWPLVEPCRSLWELGAHKSSQNLGSVGFWRRCALIAWHWLSRWVRWAFHPVLFPFSLPSAQPHVPRPRIAGRYTHGLLEPG